MIDAVWLVLRALTSKWAGIVLAIALFCGAIWYVHHDGYTKGVAAELATEADKLAEAVKAARIVQASQDKITHDVDVAYAASQTKTVTITKTITHEVPAHVTPAVDRKFLIPCGLVRLLDAATLSADPSTLPYPTGLADDTACPVAASAVAQAGVAAIRGYIQVSGELTALQAWIKEEQALSVQGNDPLGDAPEAMGHKGYPPMTDNQSNQDLGKHLTLSEPVERGLYHPHVN